MSTPESPQVLDYEGSTYRTDFWEGKGRDYEDRVERIAIQRLMPPQGERLIEVGAGYGRLAELYRGYRQIVLFDYSRSQLEFAHQQYGDEGFLYVAGNVYEMPFAPGVFDTVLMVRVLHHMQNVPAALASIRGLIKQGGVFVLEFANKRNLKAMLRWALGRQTWSPFDREPVEFVELNYDFHPRFVRESLREARFEPHRALTVSHFRLGLVKRLIPTGLLVALDSMFQFTGQLWQFTPSVFVKNIAHGDDAPAPSGAFWRCPHCGSFDMDVSETGISCRACQQVYPVQNGVYNFKGDDAGS